MDSFSIKEMGLSLKALALDLVVIRYELKVRGIDSKGGKSTMRLISFFWLANKERIFVDI